MAWQPNFNVNKACQAGVGGDTGASLWWLSRSLISAGWTAVQGGDGLTFGSGDQFAGAPSGDWNDLAVAGDWSHIESWQILRMPGSAFELCLWRHNNVGDTWQGYMQIKISMTGFVDNTNRSATRPPDAADQQFIVGSAPTTRVQFTTSASHIYAHAAADSAAINGVYRFYLLNKLQSSASVSTFFAFFAGNYGVDADLAPWTIYSLYNTLACTRTQLCDATNGPKGYRDYGGGSELFTVIPFCWFENGGGIVSPAGLVQQVDGRVYALQIPQYSVAAGAWKGITSSIKWNPLSATRGYPDRESPSALSDEGPQLYVGDVVLPWLRNEVPL